MSTQKSQLTYKGFEGSCVVSIEDDCLHGRILHIEDVITYEAQTPAELAARFKEVVGEYLAHCKAVGKQPNRPYSGSFNVRIGPERHKSLASLAAARGTSINDVICSAVDQALIAESSPNHTVFIINENRTETASSSAAILPFTQGGAHVQYATH